MALRTQADIAAAQDICRISDEELAALFNVKPDHILDARMGDAEWPEGVPEHLGDQLVLYMNYVYLRTKESLETLQEAGDDHGVGLSYYRNQRLMDAVAILSVPGSQPGSVPYNFMNAISCGVFLVLRNLGYEAGFFYTDEVGEDDSLRGFSEAMVRGAQELCGITDESLVDLTGFRLDIVEGWRQGRTDYPQTVGEFLLGQLNLMLGQVNDRVAHDVSVVGEDRDHVVIPIPYYRDQATVDAMVARAQPDAQPGAVPVGVLNATSRAIYIVLSYLDYQASFLYPEETA